MIKAIIVDDEAAAVEMLKALILPFSDRIQLCSACRNIDDAVRDIRLYRPELLLLDIELNEGLSFEILEQLPELQAHIIFITAYDHYALKAIKLHAFDYILKPVVQGELEDSLQAAIRKIGNRQSVPDHAALLSDLRAATERKLAVPGRNGLHYYSLKDIVFLEASGSYSIMHLVNGKTVTVTKKIKDFELALSGNGFLRVHKSFLAHLLHVAELRRDENGYLIMSDGSRIPLSSRDREEIMQKIRQASLIV